MKKSRLFQVTKTFLEFYRLAVKNLICKTLLIKCFRRGQIIIFESILFGSRGQKIKKLTLLSRLKDMDDWSNDDEIFEYYEELWGIHTVDRFATHYNKKCVRFNSKYLCPDTECIDAFNASWTEKNNWLVPPPNLIAKVINKFVSDRAKATLIIPEWKSSPFWPMLHDGKHFKSFVKCWKYLREKKIITYGKSKKSVFAKFPMDFKILAKKIRF